MLNDEVLDLYLSIGADEDFFNQLFLDGSISAEQLKRMKAGEP